MAMYRKPKPGEKAAAAQTRMKARRGSIAVKEEMEREETFRLKRFKNK